MGKREDQAKIRKMRKRHRYAVFSGGDSKYAERFVDRIIPVSTVDDPEALDHVKVVSVAVSVGKISLSKTIVNGSRSSVNSERMESYFERIRKKDDPLTIADLFGVRNSSYQKVWDDTPKANRVNLITEGTYRVDMFWSERRYFLVEVDMELRTIKRSRDYGKPERAKSAALSDRVMWVEKIPIK
jgi:hypothetical protein